MGLLLISRYCCCALIFAFLLANYWRNVLSEMQLWVNLHINLNMMVINVKIPLAELIYETYIQ